jgi:GT2 family glycosyltransferase
VGTVRPSLLVVAARLAAADDLDALLRCVVSAQHTAPGSPLLVVDCDTALAPLAERAADELGVAYVSQETDDGLVAARNAGLEVARANEMDAVLLAPELELVRAGWLERMRERLDTRGRPAAVVGGRVHFANGLIEHAGYYYSLLKRHWQSRFVGVPADVDEAAVPALCPVGDGIVLIRHETLGAVGLLDERFEHGLADVDYCLRAFEAGLECVYEPSAVARSTRVAATKRDETEEEAEARHRLARKHADAQIDRFIPDVL